MPSKLDIALNLAEQGFAVFPLRPNGKLPAIKEWPKRATTDAEQVERWWSGRGKDRNIGIACLDNIVVIDIDVKDGQPGAASLKQMIADGLPNTYTQRTPTGGLHLCYRAPGGHIKSVAGWRPGVDIRGNGGFIVAAGSTVDGGEYTLANPAPIVPLTTRFVDALPRPSDSSPRAEENSGAFGFGNTDSLIEGSTSPYSEIPETIPLGGRDDFIFKSACSWRERGYTRDHAEVLMQALHAKCEQKPGDEFTLADALKKLDQAWSTYKPNDSWTKVVTPDETVVEAPTREISGLKDALGRFLLAIRGSQVIDLSRQPRHAVMGLDEFKNGFKNVWIAEKQLPTVWLQNKNRQTVRDTIYYPKEVRILERDEEKFYNIYTPSNQELPDKADIEKVKPFIDHVMFILGSKEAAKLFLNWCAVTVQKPWVRVPWAPLIVTKPRMGKGFIFQALQKVLGQHNTSKIGPDDLNERKSTHNEWMSESLLVCLDEMKTTHMWEAMERLKPIMTEPTFLINHKYGKKGDEEVYFNMLCFSNHTDAAALDDSDGRFWVIYSKCVRQPQSYYDDLFGWLHSDGPAHLELWLKNLDIRSFSYNSPPPMTEAKQAMIEEARSPMEVLIQDAIDDREGPFRADVVDVLLVEQFVKDAMDKGHLNNSEIYQVRHIFIGKSEPLKQDRYRVSLDGNNKGGKRYRCRAIREFSKWYDSAPKDIAMEYRKAWHYLQGREFAPELQNVVDNDAATE